MDVAHPSTAVVCTACLLAHACTGTCWLSAGSHNHRRLSGAATRPCLNPWWLHARLPQCRYANGTPVPCSRLGVHVWILHSWAELDLAQLALGASTF